MQRKKAILYFREYKMGGGLENCLSNCSVLNLTTCSPVYTETEELTEEQVIGSFYPLIRKALLEFMLKKLNPMQLVHLNV